MADGEKMAEWIRRLRTTGDIATKAAPRVAEVLKNSVIRSAGEGRAPGGGSWPQAKSGKPVLQNVASNIEAKAVGSVASVSISDHYARHHTGRVRGGKRRQILPTDNVDDQTRAEIFDIMHEETQAHLRGENG